MITKTLYLKYYFHLCVSGIGYQQSDSRWAGSTCKAIRLARQVWLKKSHLHGALAQPGSIGDQAQALDLSRQVIGKTGHGHSLCGMIVCRARQGAQAPGAAGAPQAALLAPSPVPEVCRR